MIPLLPLTPQQRLAQFALTHWRAIAALLLVAALWIYIEHLRADVDRAEAATIKATAERDAARGRAAQFEQAYTAIAAAAKEQSAQILKLQQAQEAARIEGEKKAEAARAEAAKYKAKADELRRRQYTPGADPVDEVSGWVDELLRAERQ